MIPINWNFKEWSDLICPFVEDFRQIIVQHCVFFFNISTSWADPTLDKAVGVWLVHFAVQGVGVHDWCTDQLLLEDVYSVKPHLVGVEALSWHRFLALPSLRRKFIHEKLRNIQKWSWFYLVFFSPFVLSCVFFCLDFLPGFLRNLFFFLWIPASGLGKANIKSSTLANDPHVLFVGLNWLNVARGKRC